MVAGGPPPDRQRHIPLSLRLLACFVHGGGYRARTQIAVHGYLLVGGEKMSKTAFNQISPADLVPDFGVDGFRYHFLRDQPFGPDGDFSYEAMVARYNSDLANNLGNLLARVSAVVEQKCGGIGPAPRPDSPLADVAADVYDAAAAGLGTGSHPATLWTPPGGWSVPLMPLWKRPNRGEPSPAQTLTPCWATPWRSCGSWPCWPARPSPVPPPRFWRRIGLAGSPAGARLPDAAKWGGYPGGLPVTRGAPLFPRLSA